MIFDHALFAQRMNDWDIAQLAATVAEKQFRDAVLHWGSEPVVQSLKTHATSLRERADAMCFELGRAISSGCEPPDLVRLGAGSRAPS